MAVPINLTKDVLYNRGRHTEFNGLLVSVINEAMVSPLKRKFCGDHTARIGVNYIGNVALASISAVTLLKTILKGFGDFY